MERKTNELDGIAWKMKDKENRPRKEPLMKKLTEKSSINILKYLRDFKCENKNNELQQKQLLEVPKLAKKTHNKN